MNSLEPEIVCSAMATYRTKILVFDQGREKIAEYVLSNSFLSAALSIDELASGIGISLTTKSHFVRSLEFDGYAQFRLDLRSDFRSIHAPSYDTQSAIACATNRDHEAAFTLEENTETSSQLAVRSSPVFTIKQ